MYLAIDIGGTKTLLAVFSKNGRLLESKKIKTPQEYSALLEEIAKAHKNLNHKDEVRSCVAGAPGRINRTTGVAMAFGNLPWENVPLGEDLVRILKVPVTVENDANLAGLSEAILISHQYKKALYITISTGIGGSLITDGVIDPDLADMEFGQMVFEYEGKLQQWEDFASGRSIKEEYGKKASELNDPAAWYKISRNIALGLTNVIVNLTPDVVIIGGGVGTHFDKFADRLHEEMMIFGTNLVTVPPLRKAIRSEEAVIYGCYELARQIKD